MSPFDQMINEVELTNEALLRMARSINAAAKDPLGADPPAVGLKASAMG